MNNTNVIFQLKIGNESKKLVISPANLAALQIGGTIKDHTGKVTYKVKSLTTYLEVTPSHVFMTQSEPVLELEKV